MNKYLAFYGSKSKCCGSDSLIVKSRKGGFLSQNCTSCGKPRKIGKSQLPSLICPGCKAVFATYINENKNYAYMCDICEINFELAKVVPKWDSEFDYHGLGLPSDLGFED